MGGGCAGPSPAARHCGAKRGRPGDFGARRRAMPHTDVVPHAVEDQPQSAVTDRGHERVAEVAIRGRLGPRRGIAGLLCHRRRFLRRSAAAGEARVDVPMVAGVVLVMRVGIEDRVEVDRRHAQVADLVEFLRHAFEIAAVAAERVDVEQLAAAAAGGQRPRDRLLRDACPREFEFIGRDRLPMAHPRRLEELRWTRVVGRVSVAESLDENLVPHRALGPVGRLVPRRRGARHMLHRAEPLAPGRVGHRQPHRQSTIAHVIRQHEPHRPAARRAVHRYAERRRVMCPDQDVDRDRFAGSGREREIHQSERPGDRYGVQLGRFSDRGGHGGLLIGDGRGGECRQRP